ERLRVEQRSRRRGDEDLLPVAQRGDPGAAVDVEPDVALRRGRRASRVEAYTDADRRRCESLDGGARRGRSSLRGREGDEERVALRVDLDAVVGGDRLTDDA